MGSRARAGDILRRSWRLVEAGAVRRPLWLRAAMR